jgi:ankyrin repeat protein
MTDIDRSPEDRQGKTPLEIAIQLSQMDMAYHLIHFGAEATPKGSKTALNLAVGRGHLEMVQELLNTRARVNARDRSGRTALHFAAGLVQVEVAHLLIQHAADVNVAEDRGLTAIHFAVKYKHWESFQPDLIKILVNKHAKINAKDEARNSALYHALRRDASKDVALALLAHGLCPSEREALTVTYLYGYCPLPRLLGSRRRMHFDFRALG